MFMGLYFVNDRIFLFEESIINKFFHTKRRLSFSYIYFSFVRWGERKLWKCSWDYNLQSWSISCWPTFFLPLSEILIYLDWDIASLPNKQGFQDYEIRHVDVPFYYKLLEAIFYHIRWNPKTNGLINFLEKVEFHCQVDSRRIYLKGFLKNLSLVSFESHFIFENNKEKWFEGIPSKLVLMMYKESQ